MSIKLGVYKDSFGDIVEITSVIDYPIVEYNMLYPYRKKGRTDIDYILCKRRTFLKGYNTPLGKIIYEFY